MGKDARIDIRLPGELKLQIEEAAILLGKSVADFVTSTVEHESLRILLDARQTRLSNRDRDVFLQALDDLDAEPNAKLKAAARRWAP